MRDTKCEAVCSFSSARYNCSYLLTGSKTVINSLNGGADAAATYSERADVDVGARLIGERDDVIVISGQVRVQAGEKVFTTFKLQLETAGRAVQLAEAVISLCGVEPHATVAIRAVHCAILALYDHHNYY